VRETGVGVIAPPDDSAAIQAGLEALHARWRGGTLDGLRLDPEAKRGLSRETRIGELADLLRSVAG
jgi:hypothetical protein